MFAEHLSSGANAKNDKTTNRKKSNKNKIKYSNQKQSTNKKLLQISKQNLQINKQNTLRNNKSYASGIAPLQNRKDYTRPLQKKGPI